MWRALISVAALTALSACGPSAAEWRDISKFSLNVSESISNILSPGDDDAEQCTAVLDKEPDCRSGKSQCSANAKECLERFPELGD